jgi:tetratricopeptide (TPR) repeat protein
MMVGPYRILRHLGAGGMGEVFLAHDPRLGREVAIKRLRPESGLDPERRARLLREARVAAALNHPSIVQVFDLLEEEDGTASIVMEYVPGPTLHQLLKGGPPPVAEGLRLATAVAEGLACAHQRGVLHRDLKAENVLLPPEGPAKIADFGIARRVLGHLPGGAADETLTREGRVVGTPRAMSPEQACGDAVDARSDLFSFGVLLYEVFGGRSPFLGSTGSDTVRRLLGHDPPPVDQLRPGLPPELTDLIQELLEKSPELRPRSAAEVVDRLRACAALAPGEVTLLDAAPGPAAPPRAGSAPNSAGGRRPRLAVAALGAVLALAALLGFWLLRSSPPPPLSVAVLAPRLGGVAEGEETAFLAFALRGAVQSTLASFEGIFPKSLAEVDAVAGTPIQVARAVAADELVEASFACRDRSCSVELARLRGEDGAATWSGSVEVPLGDSLTAARAVGVLLRRGYAERRRRPGVPDLQVSPADYAEYLQVLRAVEGRSVQDVQPLLARLAAIRRGSPGLIDADLLEVTLLGQRFSSSRDPADLERALELLRSARERAPGDPEVWFRTASMELLAGRLDEATATLDAFERQAPGDARVLDLRARLLERRGRPHEALALAGAAVERHPSWVRLYEHALLAWRHGEVAAARASLERLLAGFPGNERGRQLLATLELTNGDPARAAALFEELTARSPDPGLRVNLGLARMLQGDPNGAARALEEAVATERSYLFLLNLGQARLLQGREEEAAALFRELLERSEVQGEPGDWQRLTARGQALAHLGERRQAVAAAQEALRLAPSSGQAAFEAALVYALVGDQTAALVNAERARDLGFQAPGWFRLPWFEPLLADPAFRQLAARPGSPV